LRKKKNRTIIETTNAIKHDHNVSKIPWEEACMTRYMCRTRVFTILKKNKKTPKEFFIGMKPEIEHFSLFGCPMYFHVPKEKKVQAIYFRKKGCSESSKTSLVRDRLRQVEKLSLKKRQFFFKDPENLRWRLTVR
jgi:hypothetical protein